MTLKEKLKRWTLEFAEEGAAETVTEMAIDQLPPVVILSILTYASLLVSLLSGAAGWYFDSYEALLFILSGVAAFIFVVLYLVRMYVVSRLSEWLLKGYRYAKERASVSAKTKPDATIDPPKDKKP